MQECRWEKLNGKIGEVVGFSRRHYPNFNEMPEKLVRKIFETYQDTTLVYTNGQIRGFVLYQEWPTVLNVLMACLPLETERENMKALLNGRRLVSDKPVVWFDETKMKARGNLVCHQ